MNKIVKQELDDFIKKNHFGGVVEKEELKLIAAVRTLKAVETIRDLMMIWAILTVIGAGIIIIMMIFSQGGTSALDYR